MPDGIICKACGATAEWSMDRCPRCGQDIGAPNVREVSEAEELASLNSRYDTAIGNASARNAVDRVREFEQAIRTTSRAIANLWPSLLAEFLSNGRNLFTNYNLQVGGEARKTASRPDDRQRRGTEGIVFGAYADQIRYGALSLDDRGLISYGNCAVTIADVTLVARASLMEENSYSFVRTHKILPGDPLPKGFRAGWHDRFKLAVAKLAHRIQPGTSVHEFPSLLLFSDGNRQNDNFIEVHVYGAFDHQSFVAVSGPDPKKVPRSMRPDILRIRERLATIGKPWSES
jgi:hypothetical protein